jgi:hypothetical protein
MSACCDGGMDYQMCDDWNPRYETLIMSDDLDLSDLVTYLLLSQLL